MLSVMIKVDISRGDNLLGIKIEDFIYNVKAKNPTRRRGGQGYPLLTRLFIIAAKFLSLKITNNQAEQGFRLDDNPRYKTKIIQVSKNTTLLICE